MSDVLEHYGTKRHSGRYPWGSGENPSRSLDILMKVDNLKAKGLSEKERAEELGLSINELRSQVSYANVERKQILWDSVHNRISDGKSASQIAEELNTPESTIRKYMKMDNPNAGVKEKQLSGIEETLINQVKDKGYLDVGPGVEQQLGISRNKLNTVVKKLEEDGYYVHNIYVPQVAGQQGKYTTLKTLTKDPDYANVRAHKDEIRPPEAWSDDGGTTFTFPKLKANPVGHDRVAIKYSEEGGEDRDGLMLIRKGADGLDLGNAKYAQVRISVDGTHYLKGMAMYGEDKDFPKGKDIVFNTNKSVGTPWTKVLKEQKEGPNPFGATIKRQQGAMNIVNEEGDWADWHATLSSQFLSKQPYSLIKERVSATVKQKKAGFDEIMALTNPVVKKKLLIDYADGLDADASSLKLQGIARTKSHVLLPFPDMKPDQVYAPNFKDGDRVVLVRHPHGGIFELPELTVNNKGAVKKVLGNTKDAIGIHPSVAKKLSGADFDGDTVLVIPNNQGRVKTSKALKALQDFDPNSYALKLGDNGKPLGGKKIIPKATQQTQMGIVSNLITDMTIKGAPTSDIARAVKHSMVVIDAEKHKLDWQQSAIDNSISALQRKYQSHVSKVEFDPYTGGMKPGGKKHAWGASTIVSRSSKEFKIVDPVTKKTKSKPSLMSLVDDAYKLSSGTQKENEYAGYANTMKKMAIQSRKEAERIKEPSINKTAAQSYSKEVASLNAKLDRAISNKPRERQAQLLANNEYSKAVKKGDYTNDQKKKLKSQMLATARKVTGAKREQVDITDREWEAIQNNAISKTKLNQILLNANGDRVRELATPRQQVAISPASAAKAKALQGNGYTTAEIADSLGISTSSVSKLLNGGM